jgi:hypothetical protein
MKNLHRFLVVLAFTLLYACAGSSVGDTSPAPISDDQIKLTVVKDFDGSVDV